MKKAAKDTELVRVIVSIQPEEYEAARRLAQLDGRSFSSWVRMLIRDQIGQSRSTED